MRHAPLAVLISLAIVPACTTGGASPSDRSSSVGSDGANALATVRDASGRSLGTLEVSQTTDGVMVAGTLRGLAPGVHGIHIHGVGRCDAPAFTTAGGHWNPTAHMHGFENPMGPHMGDLRNIVVGSDSVVVIRGVSTGGSLRGASGVLDADGAAIVVHAGPDDYHTDPAGNSGARVACGVIMP